jgi:maleate isomerase
MRDSLAPRLRMAVIAPSTNTIVENEMGAMRPHGVANHFAGMFVKNSQVEGDDAFRQLMTDIRASMDDAVANVMTSQPDRLILGISSESFWGGLEASRRLDREMQALTGEVPITSAGEAINTVLHDVYKVRKVAILTPYMPVGDQEVRRFFEESGFDVVRMKGLRCTSPTAIAQVPASHLREAVLELNAAEAECIVQLGTNLPFAKLAGEAEFWLDKPVLAINTVLYWRALRSSGIHDPVYGFGSLLEAH